MIRQENLSKEQNIYVEEIELKNFDVNNNEPHTHNYLEIGYFENGTGSHTIDFTAYPIKPCTLYFLRHGNVHTLFRKKGSYGKVILFSESIFTNVSVLNNLFRAVPQITVPTETFTQIQNLFTQLQEVLQTKGSNSVLAIQYINLILTYYETYAPKTLDVQGLVLDFLNYVEHHFSAKLSVESCAQHLNVSYQQLHAEVQNKLQNTPMHILQERIILEAKRLLFNTEASIKEIAGQLGFEEASYFSTYIKNNIGVSPQQFRLYSRGQKI